MGQQFDHTATLSDGTRVGYSFTRRPAGLRVSFSSPSGKRLERATGCKSKADAHNAALAIIEAVYRPLSEVTVVASWDTALADLDRTPDLRPDSVRAYKTAVKAVRALFPDLTGPADVTVEVAHRFKLRFLSGEYTRGKASDAKTHKRAPTSCATYLRCLRSLWQKHLKPVGHVTSNPWLEVSYPNAPRGKRVRVPDEETVTAFFQWLEGRHPGWELPRLFVTVKILTGCRTIDLCKAKSASLSAAGLVFTPETSKNRNTRTAPLPDDILSRLQAVAGPAWLWERAVQESKQYRPAVKTLARTHYDPSTWRWTIQNIFREFNRGRPKACHLRPHDLRARAITAIAAKTQNVDAVARALGIDPQTARHYLNAAKAFDKTEILREAAGYLRPKEGPQE